MHVFLIGFMGCGKTTLGRRLATKLEWQFIDLDHYIENFTGKSIEEIFHTEGEARFREYESQAIDEISKTEENIIISTGGGTPCFNNNMEKMNGYGKTIYLKAEFGILVNRLKNSKKVRPLIQKKTEPELHAYVLKLLAEREPFYKMAQYNVNAKNIGLEGVLKLIPGN